MQLPPQSKGHPVFHASQLKRAIGNYQCQGVLPPKLELQADIVAEPETVAGQRIILREGSQVQQSLIKWKGNSIEDLT